MDISRIKGIGPKKLEALEKMGIHDTSDFLVHFPMSYQDRSHVTRISEAVPGMEYFMDVTVLQIREWYRRGNGRKMTEITVTDGTGNMKLIFFVSSYFLKTIHKGDSIKIYGKTEQNGMDLQMNHPDISINDGRIETGILPVYQTVKGISQNQMRDMVRLALSELDDESEWIPASILDKRRIAGRKYALENMHFPSGRSAWAAARYRMVYEELFLFQTGLFLLKERRAGMKNQSKGISFPHDHYTGEFMNTLEYELTNAQKRVIGEIEKDMESDRQMERLLQGDVGSGKTAVAAAVLYKAVKNGYQGALMVPTELLAEQHYEKFHLLFEPYGIHTGFLSGSQTKKEKDSIKKRLAEGEMDLVIGTHALLQPDVEFSNLGLVVTDEQHRFGVSQRLALSFKGAYPDILVMTATPIPRSLAVILFGDMDLSVIDELPSGRLPVETRIIQGKTRNRLYHWIGDMAQEGHQAYVVAPLVADSESVDARSAEGVYGELNDMFNGRGITVGLVHGAMKPSEKEAVMRRFAAGEIQILVATVVIEVGIDVPAATVIVIENAERFGLAQLHQLRGRVGRGREQSWCFLVTDTDNENGRKRIEILTETNDGFVAAEKDLEMRGPGDFFGTRQHGLPVLRTADPVKHAAILSDVSRDVAELLQNDPQLSLMENQVLKKKVLEVYGEIPFTSVGL